MDTEYIDRISPVAKMATSTTSATSAQQVLLVGLGNRQRRDDAVGLYVAHRLRENDPGTNIKIVEEEGDMLELLDSWHDADVVFLVDAASSGSRPGTLHHFEICRGTGCEETIPEGLFLYSTHAFGLGEVVRLAQALDRLPPRLIVYGIEGDDFGMGEGISLEVLAGAEQVVSNILSYMEAAAGK